ncbi:hypothetical protein GCM10007203_12860 [Staphylococcus nepalensis]|nr:hypothetical protein GCM10007203_12860 [Staphylococcus nepalensis]
MSISKATNASTNENSKATAELIFSGNSVVPTSCLNSKVIVLPPLGTHSINIPRSYYMKHRLFLLYKSKNGLLAEL